MTAPAIAIGKFDALHKGHFALVQAAAQYGTPVVLHFSGMAEALGWPVRKPLCGEDERLDVYQIWSEALTRRVHPCCFPFAAVRDLSPEQFVDVLQQRFEPAAIVVGEDFRFGCKRSGSVEDLQRLCAAVGIHTHIHRLVKEDDSEIISSSRIRSFLAAGAVVDAAHMLGRPYAIRGMVCAGDGRGRGMGFPTANITEPEELFPAQGVYAAWASFPEIDFITEMVEEQQPVPNERFLAAVNIGSQPSIGSNRMVSCEAHLLDWQGNAYGKNLRLEFIERIRDEQQFAHAEAVSVQIQKDITAIRRQYVTSE